MTKQEYQVVVIGSGAAGSFVVDELAKNGIQVLLLEAGKDITPKDFPIDGKGPKEKGIQLWARAKATMSGQHVQAKVAMYAKQQSHLFVNDREHPYTTPPDAPFLWIRGKQLGGRLHTYGRMLLRWSDYDFKAASMDGYGIDWPLSYQELEPFYEEAERILKIYGRSEDIPNLPNSIYAGRSFLNEEENKFKGVIEREWRGRAVTGWRYAPPNAQRVPVGLTHAQATGNLDIRTDAIVKEVVTDETTGLARGVRFVDRISREEHVIHCDAVVVCASPIESVRLLLNSKSQKHPNGLGNNTDNLGRYFMDQVPNMIMGTIPNKKSYYTDSTIPADPFYGASGGIYIPRFENVSSTNPDYKRGFAYQGTIARLFTKADKPARFAIMGFGEMLPHRDNRVTLTPNRSDVWGIPIPHIACRMRDNEKSLLNSQMENINQMVRAAGLETEFNSSFIRFEEYGKGAFPDEHMFSRLLFRLNVKNSMTMGAAIHESGGARMGNDPNYSVLNSHNQVWDSPNVFVTDASSFASSGCAGTTLTVMAINIRAGRYISNFLKK